MHQPLWTDKKACAVFARSRPGGGLGNGEDCSIRLERVLVEQDGVVDAVGVRDESIRESRCVVAGFLKDNRMKLPASHRKDMCGILACWARIPLKNGEAVLVMNEVADLVEEGALPQTQTQIQTSGQKDGQSDGQTHTDRPAHTRITTDRQRDTDFFRFNTGDKHPTRTVNDYQASIFSCNPHEMCVLVVLYMTFVQAYLFWST